MKRFVSLLLLLFLVPLLVSCGLSSSYSNYYKLDRGYLARRQLETVRFETNNEDMILSSSVQVLQDLGFIINESEIKLGLITATKNREAGSTAGKVALIIASAFIGQPAVYDTKQKIYVTLVSTKSREAKGFNVRVEFTRMVWNNVNETRIEKIKDPEIYRDFFNKLGQSLFLTANAI